MKKTSKILYGSALAICLLPFEAAAQPFPPFPERHLRLVQSISFSPDGATMYFGLPHRENLEARGKADESAPRLAIYRSTWRDHSWSTPELVRFGGEYKQYEPSLSPQGDLMIFNSPVDPEGRANEEINNLWFSRRVNGEWQDPEFLIEVNTFEYDESYPTITSSGELFYVAGRPNEDKMEYSVYVTKFDGTNTQSGTKVIELDTPQGTADPWVAPDGSYILFTKFEEDWMTTCDLYIAFRIGNSWSSPVALDPLNNAEGPDYAAAVSPDEEWLYYRTKRNFLKVSFQPILQWARNQLEKSLKP